MLRSPCSVKEFERLLDKSWNSQLEPLAIVISCSHVSKSRKSKLSSNTKSPEHSCDPGAIVPCWPLIVVREGSHFNFESLGRNAAERRDEQARTRVTTKNLFMLHWKLLCDQLQWGTGFYIELGEHLDSSGPSTHLQWWWRLIYLITQEDVVFNNFDEFTTFDGQIEMARA